MATKLSRNESDIFAFSALGGIYAADVSSIKFAKEAETRVPRQNEHQSWEENHQEEEEERTT